MMGTPSKPSHRGYLQKTSDKTTWWRNLPERFSSKLLTSPLTTHPDDSLEKIEKISIDGVPLKFSRKEIVEQEISAQKLKEAITIEKGKIKEDLKELLRKYNVPVEQTDLVLSIIKKQIKSKMEEKEPNDWLLEALLKLYIRTSYEWLCK